MKKSYRMFIKNNQKLQPVMRWFFNDGTRFNTLKKNSCVLSGRSRGFFRFARLSRLFLRDPLYIGTLPGFRKSAW